MHRDRAVEILSKKVIVEGKPGSYTEDGVRHKYIGIEFPVYKNMDYAENENGEAIFLTRALILQEDLDEGFEYLKFADKKFDIVLDDVNLLDEDLVFLAENL